MHANNDEEELLLWKMGTPCYHLHWGLLSGLGLYNYLPNTIYVKGTKWF